jgi:hypothetical protein
MEHGISSVAEAVSERDLRTRGLKVARRQSRSERECQRPPADEGALGQGGWTIGRDLQLRDALAVPGRAKSGLGRSGPNVRPTQSVSSGHPGKPKAYSLLLGVPKPKLL